MFSLIGQLLLLLSFVMLWPTALYNETIKSRAFLVHYVALMLSLLTLIIALAYNDTSILYITQHSHDKLPISYRIAALYGGHNGSLLLFICSLSTWCYCCKYYVKATLYKQYSYVVSGLMILLVIFNNPFETISFIQSSQGLNPLLQDAGMMIHPPILYLGYVATILPFLISLSVSEYKVMHINLMRIVLKYSILILTIGIVLGSWWAYRVLGWGGYWGWDPVENASLLPWIMQITLYHAVISKHTIWIRRLSIMGFLITILSTMLVRGGMIASVHSFAVNSKVFLGFLSYLAILVIYSGYHYFTLAQKTQVTIKPMWLQHMISLVLIGILTLSIILPILSETILGMPIILEASFFKKLIMPLTMLMFYGMTTYLKKDRMSYIFAILTTIIYAFFTYDWASAILIGAGVGVLTTYFQINTWNLSHTSFVLMVFCMVLNAHQSYHIDAVLKINDSYSEEGVNISLLNIKDNITDNYVEKQAMIKINNTILYPSIRYFPLNDTATAKVDMQLNSYYEWYVVMGSQLEDGYWSIQVYKQYWLRWIWLFAITTALGFFTRRTN